MSGYSKQLEVDQYNVEDQDVFLDRPTQDWKLRVDPESHFFFPEELSSLWNSVLIWNGQMAMRSRPVYAQLQFLQ